MIGGPLGGWVIDICGRKIALMTTAVPFGTGWLMIGFGKSAAMLHAGRFFSGLGVGMASLITPVRVTTDSSLTSYSNYYLILSLLIRVYFCYSAYVLEILGFPMSGAY